MTDRADLPARLREHANRIDGHMAGAGTMLDMGPIEADLREAADALSAIASRQAVVPLEWVELADDRGDGTREPNGDWEAETPFGFYEVEMVTSGDVVVWGLTFGIEGDYIGGDHASPDEAKAAAQADYTQRINSALAALVRDETEIRAAALEEAAAECRAVRGRLSAGRGNRPLNQIDEHVASVAETLADRILALSQSPDREAATREAVIAMLTAPILWSEIRPAVGRNGDPIDFTAMEVQSAACKILRDRRALAEQPKPQQEKI